MHIEAATVLVIIIGSLFVLFLLIPLIIVLVRLRRVWQANRGTGALMGAVVFWTGFLFILLFAAFGALIYEGTTLGR